MSSDWSNAMVELHRSAGTAFGGIEYADVSHGVDISVIRCA